MMIYPLQKNELLLTEVETVFGVGDFISQSVNLYDIIIDLHFSTSESVDSIQ